MASSKPVVATSTAGIGEVIIKGKTGFLVAPGNVEEIAEKLTILLKDKSLRKQIGRNAKDFLGSSFSLESMVKSHQDLYEDLVRKKEG
jgi:glycosyltransferase involved in cell wall biosynthesis